jgi:putative phosphoesterase
VLGNTEDLISVGGKKVFYAHGHTFGVKSGLDRLKEKARQLSADIVLFGHTHVATTFYEDGIYYMNPGSVTNPQQGGPSYGVVDITDAGVVTFTVAL